MDFNVSFEEDQTIDPAVSGGVYALLALIGAVVYVALRESGEADVALLALAPSFVIVAVIFQTLTMRTSVDPSGVTIKTLYVVTRKISFDEIERVEAVAYRPLLDYGGWGIRISRKGKAYNLRGNRGVQLYLKNGGRVLVGSQRDEALAMAIEAGLR